MGLTIWNLPVDTNRALGHVRFCEFVHFYGTVPFIFSGKILCAYILFDYGNFGNAALDGCLVEVGNAWIPVERVAIACKNNDHIYIYIKR